MADKPICSIPDCNKPAVTRGWCAAHYTRWLRYGDVNVRMVRRGDAHSFIYDDAIPYDGHDCLFWPFTKTKGYGWVKFNGKGAYAHRVICELVHGAPPTSNSVVRHSCANGHLACVNPKHLSWGTYKENSNDCAEHGHVARGERQGSSKLKERDVLTILAERGITSSRTLAKRYGVNPNTIYRVWNGERWAWLRA